MTEIPTRMKAVRISQSGVNVVEEPVPTPGPKQLLIKIGSAGVCHSDLQIFHTLAAKQASGEDWSIIPSHEACGTIAGLGSDVQDFEVGQDVGFLLYLDACTTCEACSINPVACPSVKLQGFYHDGFMSEYAIVEASQAIRLCKGMNPKQTAPLFCAGLTAYHAVKKSGIQRDQWYAVVGVGGLGTFAVKYALKMGFKVLAIDVGSKQMATAQALGAHAVFNATEPDLATKVRKLTVGGVHAAAPFSGSPKAYQSAASILRVGGKLICVGITDPEPLPLPTSTITLNLINIVGVSSGRADEMKEAVDFTFSNGISCDAETYSIEQYPEVMQRMREGKATGRMMVVF